MCVLRPGKRNASNVKPLFKIYTILTGWSN